MMSMVLCPACDNPKTRTSIEYLLQLDDYFLKPLISDLGIIITDHHTKIKYVNRSFSNITGYSLKEVRGKNPSVLQSGYYGTSFYRDMWSTIENTGQWKGEILDRRKDGRIYWESLHIMRMNNENDEVTGYIGIIYDKKGSNAHQQEYISELQEQLYCLMMIKGIVDTEASLIMRKLDKVIQNNRLYRNDCKSFE